MTKYSFVIFHKEVDQFLENLQSVGLVDVTRQTKAIDTRSKELFDMLSRYNAVINTLEGINKKGTETQSNNPLPDENSLLEVVEQKLSLRQEMKLAWAEAKRALSESEPWGEFNAADLERLHSLGYTPHFYTCSTKRFNKAWEEQYPLHILNTDKNGGKIYFVILSDGNEEFKFDLTEVKFPETPAKEINARIAEIETKTGKNENELVLLAQALNTLKTQKEEIEQQLDLYLAQAYSQKGAEDTILIFEGFAPTESEEQVTALLEENHVYYLKEEAKLEDNPPIKLKNNFFTRLYEPIGELYMLPRYGETDLTPYFAPFYMLFFGLCLGDMGYGLILFIAGLFVNFKVPAYKGYGKLVAWLGVGAILMPALNGTFFGTKLGEILPLPEHIKGLFFSDMKMFWFAIIFGLVQIVFARLLNAFFAIKNNGIQAGLHNIGWAIIITVLAIWYASMEVPFSYPAFVNYIGWGGLLLILLFTSDNKNIFVKLFKGVSALYDITGVFGDMLSYIRLFGLGTAGGILGMVVNSVAMQMSGIPYMGWVLAILMLIVGHTMVLLLSCLGAFVHPMRLTFVEFYKNAGFEGGGRAYKPLSKRKK